MEKKTGTFRDILEVLWKYNVALYNPETHEIKNHTNGYYQFLGTLQAREMPPAIIWDQVIQQYMVTNSPKYVHEILFNKKNVWIRFYKTGGSLYIDLVSPNSSVSAKESALEKFAKDVDWKLLQEQKQGLWRLFLLQKETDALNGVMGLIDNLQQAVVKDRMFDENEIFQSEEE